MAKAGLYNENAFRAYPFITPAYLPDGLPASGLDLPSSAILDMGLIMGPQAGYTAAYRVYLYTISRAGSTFTFEFRTDAPGASTYGLVFTRDLTEPEYATEFSEAGTTSGSSSSAAGDCTTLPLWEGFLVTGDLTELGELIADGETKTYTGQWEIEPALIQNLAAAFVTSINLANITRTHVTPTGECSLSSSSSADVIYVQATCLQGDVKLVEGFSAVITQDDIANSLTIGASVGAGEGLPCEEVPLYAGEVPPPGSSLLTGGPSCDEIVRTINGVGGRVLRLYAGNGVSIEPHETEPNTLVVTVGLGDFATCA